MNKQVKILCYDCDYEALTIRNVLENFGIKVDMCYIGRPQHFIDELNKKDGSFYYIICGHGNHEEFVLPALVEDRYLEDEPKKITAKIIEEKVLVNNSLVISTACETGSEAIAEVFTNKNNYYLAPTDCIEGTSALFFVIRFYYEHFILNKNIEEAVETTRMTDRECSIYKLFKK